MHNGLPEDSGGLISVGEAMGGGESGPMGSVWMAGSFWFPPPWVKNSGGKGGGGGKGLAARG